jgi:hypothetical protein
MIQTRKDYSGSIDASGFQSYDSSIQTQDFAPGNGFGGD